MAGAHYTRLYSFGAVPRPLLVLLDQRQPVESMDLSFRLHFGSAREWQKRPKKASWFTGTPFLLAKESGAT